MPNWCFQTLEIVGTHEEINNFVVAMTEEIPQVGKSGSGKYSLNQMFPCPEELVNTVSGWTNESGEQTARDRQYESNIAKYGYKDWYDWANDIWGTKWGACSVELRDHSWSKDRTHSVVSVGFESAWCPATQLIQRISESYPNCVFGLSFTEESNAFAGCVGISNGQLLFDKTIDMEDRPDFDIDTDEGYDKYHEWEFGIIQAIDETLDEFMAEEVKKFLHS
jgi:hypothetical protein